MEVVQGVQNGYTVLNLEMNKVQQCNSCILNTLHHGIIMMSDNNGIPDNNGKIQENNEKYHGDEGDVGIVSELSGILTAVSSSYIADPE